LSIFGEEEADIRDPMGVRLHDRLMTGDQGGLDPMFLPRSLAGKFLLTYEHIIHPLFPVLDIGLVTRSIHMAYDGSTTIRSSKGKGRVSEQLDRARDLLVLTFGAQVIGGDGDVSCPKDVAIVWSETLRRHVRVIMKEYDDTGPSTDLINLWIVYAAFSRSYGNSEGESFDVD
jgi:hypothetical protein